MADLKQHEHVIGCLVAQRVQGNVCVCEQVREDAARKALEFARNTPWPPIDGHRWKDWQGR